MGKIIIKGVEEAIFAESPTRMVTLRREKNAIIETSRNKVRLEEGRVYLLTPGTPVYASQNKVMESQGL